MIARYERSYMAELVKKNDVQSFLQMHENPHSVCTGSGYESSPRTASLQKK
jgi:hypothetical protein